MAVYNEIQVGRYVRFLQKFFQIKGRQPAPLQYSGELGAVMPLFHGAENRYLEGWNLFGAVVALPALAASVNGFRWRNPASSNGIAVFTKMMILTSGASLFQVSATNGPSATDLVTLLASGSPRLDARQGSVAASILTASTNQAGSIAGLANTFGIAFVGNVAGALPEQDLIYDACQEVPLLPGDAIQFTSGTVNLPTTISLMWRERLLEESERA